MRGSAIRLDEIYELHIKVGNLGRGVAGVQR